MTTFAQARTLTYRQPFWYVHIEGFPYVFSTRAQPSTWSLPQGLTWESSLYAPDESITYRIDPTAGIIDADTITLRIDGNTILSLLGRIPTATSSARLDDMLDAGALNQIIYIDSAIADAPVYDLESNLGEGTIYIDRTLETVTYRVYDGDVTFNSTERGRWAYLGNDLSEKRFARWLPLNTEQPGSLVSLHPTRIIGRTLTLWRNYVDLSTGVELAASEGQIRYRGQISTFGDTNDHLGTELQVTNLITLLEAKVLTNLGRGKLRGIHVPPVSSAHASLTIRDWLTKDLSNPLTSTEQLQSGISTVSTSIYPKNHSPISTFDNADAVIDELNLRLAANTQPYTGELLGNWRVRKTNENKARIYADPALYLYGSTAHRGFYPVAKGVPYNPSTPLYYLLGGELEKNTVAEVLGFGDADASWNSLAGDITDLATYKKMARFYQDPTNNKLGTQEPYLQLGAEAEKILPKVYWPADRAWHVPYTPESDRPFVASPGDGSEFRVYVEGYTTYRASGIDSTNNAINLIDAFYDFNHLFGTSKKPEKSVHIEADKEDDDIPSVYQAWVPNGRRVFWLHGNAGYQFGIHNTIMQLLSSTGTPGYNGAWDILSAGWGLSIPVDWIDTASFENLFDVFTGNLLDREYIFTEPFVMREFLEQECKLLGWNLTVINGKLTAVAYESPTLANSVLTIDDTIRTSEGQESNGGQWVHAPEQLINRITLKGAYDLVEDEFRIDTTYGNAVGQLDAGVTNGLAIECTGLGNKFMRAAETFEAKLSSVIAGLVARMFELSQQTYNYTCTCNDLIDNLTPGQIVDVTDSYVPNPLTNTRGITRSVGRVIEVAYNELEGTGTITVRLSYPYVNTLSSVTTTEWNKGNLAPALWMDGIAADNLTIDVSEGYFGGTTSGPAQWAAGDAVQLREVNNPTAQVITGTVSSVVEDGATRRIILSGAATITGSQYTVSPVAFSEADSTKGSFIAGDTGLLSSATVLGTGYKW